MQLSVTLCGTYDDYLYNKKTTIKNRKPSCFPWTCFMANIGTFAQVPLEVDTNDMGVSLLR